MATTSTGNNTKTLFLLQIPVTHFLSRRYVSNAAGFSVTQFEKLVQTRCKSRDLSLTEAFGYFNSMLEMNPMPSVWALNQLLGSLSRMRQCSTAVSMYAQLMRFRSSDFDPDSSTLNIIIKCLGRLNSSKLGFSVLGTMFKSGIQYDSLTLSSLLDGLCRQGSVADAMQLFEKLKMEEKELCDVVTYGTVINMLCQAGESRKALETLKHMLDNDATKPDIYIFSSVIDCLCGHGQVDEAVSLFQGMINYGVRPDLILYTSLIRGLCRFGHREKAKNLLKEMVEGGISPDVYTYTIFIDLLFRDEKIDAALSVFQEMVSRGVVPDIVCYNSLIFGLSTSGKWHNVIQILGNMKAHGVSPNIVTFGSILDARFKERNTTAALHVVGVMAEKRILPDFVASSSFLSGLSRVARTEEAKILADMKNVVVVADITHTLNIILNGLFMGFMILEAQKLFKVMLDHAKFNVHTFTIRINAHCLRGDMDKAKDVFDRMQVNGVFPDTVTFNTLAEGYLKVQRIDGALKILKSMIMYGLLPDEATRKTLKTIHSNRYVAALYYSHRGENESAHNGLNAFSYVLD